VTDLIERVHAGDTRAAARLCRLVDDRVPGYRAFLAQLSRDGAPAPVIGITGSPGAGKSTLVDRLIGAYRAVGKRVGVVAVDPTSPYTGGAILGDRVRMQRHFEDPEVFIRSLATRGALGGLSRSARHVTAVLVAWGAKIVLLETVGVGQDELDVTLVADTTVVVVSPGQGDDIQAVKAGLLECADVFAVNKADRPGADNTVRDLENMLALGALTGSAPATPGHGHSAVRLDRSSGERAGEWTPPVVKTVAATGDGVLELVGRIGDHGAWNETPQGRARTARRVASLLGTELRNSVAELVADALAGDLSTAVDDVLAGRRDVDGAIDALLARFGLDPGAAAGRK